MKLIERLPVEIGISKNGNKIARYYGLFECPVCHKLVKKNFHQGPKYETCGKKECGGGRGFRHGQEGTKLYVCWEHLKKRCNNPKHKSYANYGGKGITYPTKWDNFKGFLEDMGDTYQEGLTLDRVDNTQSYSKENCQWLPRSENAAKDRRKQIIKLDMEGNELARYSSAKEAAKVEEIKYPAAITKVARGERKQYKGFNWQYV